MEKIKNLKDNDVDTLFNYLFDIDHKKRELEDYYALESEDELISDLHTNDIVF